MRGPQLHSPRACPPPLPPASPSAPASQAAHLAALHAALLPGRLPEARVASQCIHCAPRRALCRRGSSLCRICGGMCRRGKACAGAAHGCRGRRAQHGWLADHNTWLVSSRRGGSGSVRHRQRMRVHMLGAGARQRRRPSDRQHNSACTSVAAEQVQQRASECSEVEQQGGANMQLWRMQHLMHRRVT